MNIVEVIITWECELKYEEIKGLNIKLNVSANNIHYTISTIAKSENTILIGSYSSGLSSWHVESGKDLQCGECNGIGHDREAFHLASLFA